VISYFIHRIQKYKGFILNSIIVNTRTVLQNIQLAGVKFSVVVVTIYMINFQNLFCFGDRDGKHFDAKLQHPMGVAWCNKDETLYIADSYNHKLKAISVPSNVCTTLLGSGKPGSSTGHYERPHNVQVNTTRMHVM
jgi:hypothetical protein